MRKETEEFTLRDLLTLFLPKVWIILLCGILCAGAIGAYSVFLQDDTYTSSATIYVYKERSNESASTTYYDSITSQKMVKTYGVVLKSRTFLTKVINNIDDAEDYGISSSAISSSLEIKQVDDTEIFNITFTSKDKDLTYKVLSEITVLAQTEIQKTIPNASDVRIIDDPQEPTSPDSKNLLRNTLIAFSAGVLVAMISIFIYNQFDVVIRNKKRIEDNFSIPVLGVIPRQSVGARRMEGTSDEI